MYLILPLMLLIVVIAALADIITRDDSQIKHLPKVMWVVIVILLPLVGSILWFAIGREYSPRPDLGGFGDPRRRGASSSGRSVNDQRVSPSATSTGATSLWASGAQRQLSTEQQLAELDAEIARYERQARVAKLEAEIAERRQSPPDARGARAE